MMAGETVLVDGVAVDNVLVEPGNVKDAQEISVPLGTVVKYTLRFPCGYDGPIEGAKITVRGQELDSIGYADHWKPADVFGSWTNPWDMTVIVGRTLGDFTAHIEVFAVYATLDVLGDAVSSESTVYEGPAQARHSYSKDTDGTALDRDVAETWWFVAPWQDGFAGLRPESTAIVYDGARYTVRDLANVDNRCEYMSFEAVRTYYGAESGETGETGTTGETGITGA